MLQFVVRHSPVRRLGDDDSSDVGERLTAASLRASRLLLAQQQQAAELGLDGAGRAPGRLARTPGGSGGGGSPP
jgi:hypothetical protein